MRYGIALILPMAALAGCAGYAGDAPIVEGGPVAAEGSAVALGQPVAAGDVVLTPMAVIEDSRCATGTQCVWAGRAVVTTRIDGAGWRETVDLVAGDSTAVRDYGIILAHVAPERTAGGDIAAGDYRFIFMVE
ncbi:hypothetical protein [Croceicoccus sp. Ery5]|uniref:hypothetical protein n=1 Tax=Croceicoccus sp. Ery5 TaxID=1703340 RepID=UPI001E39759D|nr:hypothetical protein [Croceicoccus sp. Ery5]